MRSEGVDIGIRPVQQHGQSSVLRLEPAQPDGANRFTVFDYHGQPALAIDTVQRLLWAIYGKDTAPDGMSLISTTIGQFTPKVRAILRPHQKLALYDIAGLISPLDFMFGSLEQHLLTLERYQAIIPNKTAMVLVWADVLEILRCMNLQHA